MFASIRSRLMLTYTLVIAFVLVIVLVIILAFLARNPLASRQAWQKIRTLMTVLQGVQALDFNTPQAGSKFIERTSQVFGVRVAVFDSTGNLLQDSDANTSASLPEFEILRNRAENNPSAWFRDGTGVIWLYEFRTLPSGFSILLATPRPRTPFIAILGDEFIRPFSWALFTALLLSLILAGWMSRWVAAPLQRLAQGTKSVASGTYTPIPLEGPSEVRQFGQAFNEMVLQVQATQRAQRDFVANVSHELKTPLTSIRGFAQAILDGTADSIEATRQSAEVIYCEADRMNRLVHALLDLASLDSGTIKFKFEQFDLVPLLSDTAKKLSPLAAEAGVEVILDLPETILLSGDQDRLAQVFNNLLDNAIKFTPAGKPVTLAAHQTSDWVIVRVEDNGPGIPREERERIFERFYRLDKSRKSGKHGAGLGLAIAREIVLAHGGKIQVESSPTQGSIFLVRLPL